MKQAARCGGGPKVTDNSIDAHNTTAPSRPQAPAQKQPPPAPDAAFAEGAL